jgi:hypothetical protein
MRSRPSVRRASSLAGPRLFDHPRAVKVKADALHVVELANASCRSEGRSISLHQFERLAAATMATQGTGGEGEGGFSRCPPIVAEYRIASMWV